MRKFIYRIEAALKMKNTDKKTTALGNLWRDIATQIAITPRWPAAAGFAGLILGVTGMVVSLFNPVVGLTMLAGAGAGMITSAISMRTEKNHRILLKKCEAEMTRMEYAGYAAKPETQKLARKFLKSVEHQQMETAEKAYTKLVEKRNLLS